MDWREFLFEYFCPVGGCFLASSIFAAPINDLNDALERASLGSLNTTPWAIMTGNCLGWCAYSYYTSDPFVLATNLPGLLLSLWLNIGACKLQYLAEIERKNTIVEPNNNNNNNNNNNERSVDLSLRGSLEHTPEGHNNNNNNNNRGKQGVSEQRTHHATNTTNTTTRPLSLSLSLPPPPSPQQEAVLLAILSFWSVVLVGVRWGNGLLRQAGMPFCEPQSVVGVVVNANLVFFYGAPLQTIKTVLKERSSDTIHTPTVVTSLASAVFWMVYGLARKDAIIYGPNGVGLVLGLCQVALCCLYPKKNGRSLSSSFASSPSVAAA